MKKLLLIGCLIVSQNAFASELIWTDIEPTLQSRQSGSNNQKRHNHVRRLKLDLVKLKQKLYENSTSKPQFIELPLPDGEQMVFKLKPSKVMASDLADRYPEIRTWRVSNPDNPAIQGRIDISPNGFHGLINTQDGERVFIDPEGDKTLNEYTSRLGQQHINDDTFKCELHGSHPLLPRHSPFQTANRAIGGTADPLRTYRIAIATTGEYTQLFGGTKSQSLSSVVTTLNRLNQVFERDLSVNFELIAQNDSLIYTSPGSDPFSNEDASAMVEENVVNTNAVIGTDSYDIGHVFGTGNTGGLAFINSACGTFKAGGVTGSNTPTGESFNIDYVAHEIGHQLGASHTFNGTQLNCMGGNRTPETAVEPGSGSSIMGYAGICGSDDLQANSDAFFHSASIKQIKSFTQNASGANCGTLTTQQNTSPTVSAGSDYAIPAETPFKLSGTSSDADSDQIIHSWEQIDTGSAGGLFFDLGDNPLFRTWPPVSSNTRYFPKLDDLLSNTATIGETLPSTDREMNFVLLTRDNKGGVTEDAMKVTVVNTGNPFEVLSQTDTTTLSASQNLSVQWEVANTTQAPISCSSVDISLINNNGLSSTLLENTPNDGAQSFTTPSDLASLQDANLMVSCTNNIFFAVSRGKINVLGGYPVLSANAPTINEGDSGIRYLTFILSLSSTASENIAVNYSVTESFSSATIKQGMAVINQGSNSVTIQVPVVGDTATESNQVYNLTLMKPLNAQFANESDSLTATGTIIDDDVSIVLVAANPDTSEADTNSSSSSSSGGGLFNLFSIFGLLLLLAHRKIILRIK